MKINKINILVHGMSANPGGIENFVMNYYRKINSQIIHFDFLCINVNGKPAYYQEIIDGGSKVYNIPGRRKYFTCRKQLMTILKNNKYDVFWSNECMLPMSSLLFKSAFKQQVPIRIIHAHNAQSMSNNIIDIISHIIEKRRIKKYVTDFWACSEMAARYFYDDSIIRSSKFKIIRNAIDIQKYSFNETIRTDIRNNLDISNKFVIGHIGRFHFQKNHDFLIRIFSEIYKREPTAILLLIGDGHLKRKIENQVKNLNLIDAVYFMGIRNDIPELLNAMDIFLLPSKFEGLPFVLVEAQSASLYCFISDTITDEVALTDKIIFIDSNTLPEKWAEAILEKRYYDRNNYAVDVNIIKEKGYDIITEASALERFFYEKINNKYN
jgi:glycosyltransferase involved in cell wall biosynthesis